MTIGYDLRVVNALLALVTLLPFAAAIVHARDHVDRWYLLGGFMLVVVSGIGSFTHLRAPFQWDVTPLITVGLLLMLVGAVESWRRRRGPGQ